MEITDQSPTPGIRHFVDVIRRRKWVLIQVAVLVPLLAVFLSLRQDKLYEANAEVLVGQQDLAATLAGVASFYYGSDRELQVQAEIARSPLVARRALSAAGVRDRSPEQLLAASSVSPKPDVDVLRFSVRDEDPELARVLANAYATQYLRRNLALEQEALAKAKQVLDQRIRAGGRRSPVYETLVDRQEQLKTLEDLRDSSQELALVHPAGGAALVQPRPRRNAGLGAILGLVLGLGIIFLWEALDTRVRHADEVSRRLRLPLLARVPRRPRRGDSERPVMLENPGGPQAEPYRILRTNVEFLALQHDVRVLMITSALGQEGKTTTAANLAVSLARAGRRVTVVDLDLRRPSLARHFELDRNRGLTDVALGHADLEDVLVTIPLPADGVSRPSNGDWYQPPGNGRASVGSLIRVLPAGPLPPDPGELAGGRAVAGILSRLRESSDLVIVDTPPLLHVGDAMALSANVDALVVVVKLDILRSPTLRELGRVLEGCPARRLGYVLTGAEALEDYYGYSGYYYEQRPPAPEERARQTTPA